MRKLLVSLSFGAALVGSVAMAACVGEEPSTTSATQGALNGPCFANGTCNAGLSCAVVDGTTKCTTPGTTTPPPPSGDASTVDAAPVVVPDGAPVEPAACKFQTTPFPCGNPMPPKVCYGATQSCTLTGCNPSDIAWECNSARQCGTPCCVPPTSATLTAGANCTEGTLLMTVGATSGAACSNATACKAGETQLCQANSDCPKGQRCTPVKIVGAGAALNGTIVAACAP